MNGNFQVPNKSQLNNLMEGCFVRVQDNQDCYWVELDEVKDQGLAGVIHSELEDSNSKGNLQDQKRICFQRDQITHVGCDRFCFC